MSQPSDLSKLEYYYASLLGIPISDLKRQALEQLILGDEKRLRIMKILKRESSEIYVRVGGRQLDSLLERREKVNPNPEIQVDYWNLKVEDAKFNARIKNSCYTGAIDTIGELAQKTREELLHKRYTFGKKGVRDVIKMLASMEMWLGMTYEQYQAKISKS